MITISALELGVALLAVFAAGAAVAWMFFSERAFWLAQDYRYVLQRRQRALEEAEGLLTQALETMDHDDLVDAVTAAKRRVAAVAFWMRGVPHPDHFNKPLRVKFVEVTE